MRDAVELVAEGIDGLEPFDMPVSTAGGLAVAHKALDIVDRELDPLWEKSKKQPLDLDDITRMRRILRARTEIQKLVASVPRSNAEAEGDAAEKAESALLEKVRREMNQQKTSKDANGDGH